jgi:hypothetical protein
MPQIPERPDVNTIRRSYLASVCLLFAFWKRRFQREHGCDRGTSAKSAAAKRSGKNYLLIISILPDLSVAGLLALVEVDFWQLPFVFENERLRTILSVKHNRLGSLIINAEFVSVVGPGNLNA